MNKTLFNTDKNQDFIKKTIAWNSIALNVPPDWEIDTLDTQYLLIGESEEPKIEIKWTEAPGKFILADYLKKFIHRSQKNLGIKIYEQMTPDNFSHPEKQFEFFFFLWKNFKGKGHGTLVFCHYCKKLSLIRFFNNQQIGSNVQSDIILNSYSDHPENTYTRWNIFGLDIKTPKYFQLQDYTFEPGAYTLTFKHKKTKLSILSWGPASFILSGTTLSEFAKNNINGISGSAESGTCKKGSFLEWYFRYERFKNAGRLPGLKNTALFAVFRICQDKKENRILAVMTISAEKYEYSLIQKSFIGDE